MSKGERLIAKLLSESNIKFVQEKTYKDLRGGSFRFDFYLPDKNVCIEFQGAQHYEFSSHFYKTKLDFKAAQGRDMRKISYCLARKIPLYIIPYWEIDKLTTAADLFNEKYLTHNRYKNLLDYQNFTAGIY